MDVSSVPREWQTAYRRDLTEKPVLPDPLPERRIARLLAAFVVTGLFFMVLPGTVLGVWNLVGISSQRALAGVSTAWIQAHGHAQFFGWVGTFILGISLYTLPKFRGAMCRSVAVGWAIWAMWTAGVGLRWFAGVQGEVHHWEFILSAALEFVSGILVLWQVTAAGPKRKKGEAWQAPIFGGLTILVALLAWQLVLAAGPFSSPALPDAPDRLLISLALWLFAFPVVIGYSAKLFAGLLGTAPVSAGGLRLALAAAVAAALGFAIGNPALAGSAAFAAAIAAVWSLRIFHAETGKPKRSGVYQRYPEFARLAYVWLAIAALLTFGVPRAGMLGASRHAFTVGFLATLIFSIGPRILPSFLNSRELWSNRLMAASLVLLTAGCTLRVVSEPLAYGGILPLAWKTLPVSAFAELTAVLLFAFNLAMSLATPVPAWFGRKNVNDRMTVYWLIGSYPASRRVMVENGLKTLSAVDTIPKTLSLAEAARADEVDPGVLVARLGDFFEARLPRSLRTAPAAPGRRRSLVFPREHGAWGILLVPLVTGACCGLFGGGSAGGLAPLVVVALSLFWLRTPVESWLGTAAIRARTAEEFRLVRKAVLLLSVAALVGLAWLFWGGRNLALIPIGAAAGAAFVAQAVVKRIWRGARTAAQVVGAAGLTATAAAAYVVASGRPGMAAWSLWAANLAFAMNQIQFVQLRIRAARAESFAQKLALGRGFLAGQILLTALVPAACSAGIFPWFAAVAFLPLLARGYAWFAAGPQPLAIHAVGKSELFYACVFGILLIAGMPVA